MAIAVVHSVSAGGNNVTSITTPSMATTTGNLVIVDCVYYPNNSFSSQTDSKGLTWSSAVPENVGTVLSIRQNYNANITGDAAHTFTLTITGGLTYPTICAKEVSGAAAAPLDKTATGLDAFGTAHTTANTATTTQANELLSGFGCDDSGATPSFSVSSPWTQDQNQAHTNAAVGLISASRVVSATGAYAFTFTTSQDIAGICAISTWKQALPPLAPPAPNISQAVKRAAYY